MNTNDLENFGEWLRENFTTIQGGWMFAIYNKEVRRITSKEIVGFYLFCINNFKLEEETGYWYDKENEITYRLTIETLYKIYKCRL